METRKFLKILLYSEHPGLWGNGFSCEDKLWGKKPGLYTSHKWSFAKIQFNIILSE